MNISFNGFGEQVATFISQNTTKNVPVKVSANGTVAACSAGDDFCGIAIAARNGLNSVLMGGYVEVPFSGTAPSLGYATLAADGSGGVKTVTTGGREHLVVFVGTSTVGIIL